MIITKHKSKSSLMKEIKAFLDNGGVQVAVCLITDEDGQEVYQFSRPSRQVKGQNKKEA